ncbi:MAG: LegC family aminotransferase [Betaproteobacteria bacterium]|nr:LegC family aminotransferase [Betaproteobacteria bacterium]
MSFNSELVIEALRSVAGARAVLHEPEFRGKEWDYLKDCLDSTFVSSVGRYVGQFETMLAEATGTAHAVAVVNGTAALQVCLRLAGVGRGDEVLVPALSFVATANAVVHAGGVPHFVDSDTATLGISPMKLAAHLAEIAEEREDGCYNKQSGARLAALVPMHVFGHPVDLDALLPLAARYRIPLIEDAAESLGSLYRGRHTGSFGLCSALSFNGNKIITTGGGGAILSNDPELARRAKHLTTTAKLPHPWAFDHDEIAYNYRLPNINAALGCAQMEALPERVAAKRALAERYFAAFEGIDGVRVFREPEYARSNYWLNTLLLDGEDCAARRDEILKLSNEAGIMTRPAWTLLHRLPMYTQAPRDDLSVAEDLERRIVNVPSSAHLANGGN